MAKLQKIWKFAAKWTYYKSFLVENSHVIFLYKMENAGFLKRCYKALKSYQKMLRKLIASIDA